MVCCCLSVAAFAADPVVIEGEPVFDGLNFAGRVPVMITLTNKSSDLRATLSVQTNLHSLNYPVELPAGSKKRILTYPTNSFGQIEYTLSGRGIHETFKIDLPPPSQAAGRLLAITDNPGSATFIRRNESAQKESVMQDGYCKAENAPDRSSGYASLTAVLLGAGSERLSNESVAALKQFVLKGGDLIFTGGASNASTSDPRWSDMLAVSDLHRENRRAQSGWDVFAGSTPEGTYTASIGKPVNGAKVTASVDGFALAVSRPFGLGRTSYLAIDPTEPPFNRWDGRAALFSKLWSATDSIQSRSYLAAMGGENPNQVGGTPGGFTGINRGVDATNPFSFKLPETSRIFSVLGLYFIVVIPVNFLILRKLKRGELAWFTAPMISLLFAGILFKQAQGLYAFQTSTANSGVMIFHDAVPEGTYVGRTQFFIAQSGVYDLNLKDTETIGPANDTDYYPSYNRQRNDETIETVDNGRDLNVPNLAARNLAFRQLSISQRLPGNNRLKIVSSKLPNGKYRLRITNPTSFTFSDMVVFSGSRVTGLEATVPGQTHIVDVSIGAPDTAKGQLGSTNMISNDIRTAIERTGQIAVYSKVKGFRPGPQIGREVETASLIQHLQFVNIASEGRP